MATYAINKKARHDYEILRSFEAGIQLAGFEVKAIKEGNVHLKGAYVSLRNGELWLVNAYVGKYSKAGNLSDYDPERPRKLLVRKREIRFLADKLAQKGLTLVPISVYNKGNRIKVEFSLVRGKKKHDKRAAQKERDVNRKIQRTLKNQY
jgi:SsrA-binding protein